MTNNDLNAHYVYIIFSFIFEKEIFAYFYRYDSSTNLIYISVFITLQEKIYDKEWNKEQDSFQYLILYSYSNQLLSSMSCKFIILLQ